MKGLTTYCQENWNDFIPYYHYTPCKRNVVKGFKAHEYYSMLLLSAHSQQLMKMLLGVTKTHEREGFYVDKYQEKAIKKKNGKKRILHIPYSKLKKIQSRLNSFLQNYYLLYRPDFVHGFIFENASYNKKSGIVENAKAHVGKNYILSVDIKEFFNSISDVKVKALFMSDYFNFDNKLASFLAHITTYNACLPTGAPTSPVLSNFLFLPIDYMIQEIAQKHNLTFTRYADDITFSSDLPIDLTIVMDVQRILEKFGFTLNTKKTRLKTKSSKQLVTGIVVNEKLNVKRSMLKNTRAMLHDACSNGLINAAVNHFNRYNISEDDVKLFVNRLKGNIEFIGYVRGKDDAQYIKLSQTFKNRCYSAVL